MPKTFSEVIKSDDWKTEKHVPVITCPDSLPSGELTDVTVAVGAEVAHPNTTAHHIAWITLYFQPEGGQVYQIGHFEFSAHGASTDGADSSGIYTNHQASTQFKTDKGGTLFAESYCNIHGVWEGSKEIAVS